MTNYTYVHRNIKLWKNAHIKVLNNQLLRVSRIIIYMVSNDQP